MADEEDTGEHATDAARYHGPIKGYEYTSLVIDEVDERDVWRGRQPWRSTRSNTATSPPPSRATLPDATARIFVDGIQMPSGVSTMRGSRRYVVPQRWPWSRDATRTVRIMGAMCRVLSYDGPLANVVVSEPGTSRWRHGHTFQVRLRRRR